MRDCPWVRPSPDYQATELITVPTANLVSCLFSIKKSARVCAMESQARNIAVGAGDRRQSETALAIARGTARPSRSLGFSCISELPVAAGRRADLVALMILDFIWMIEV